VIALLARIYPDSATPDAEREMLGKFRTVKQQYPEIFESLRPSARQVRRFLRERGIRKDPSIATTEYPLLSLKHPIIAFCASQVALKLCCALHYKHAGKIIPKSGGVLWEWRSNEEMARPTIPSQLFELVKERPILMRGRTDLSDQFDYRYHCSEDEGSAVYLITFNLSLLIIGWVCLDARKFPEFPGHAVVHPGDYLKRFERRHVRET
jgi:hypothetical protein